MSIAPQSLDHVALWTDERDALAEYCCEKLGMHEIERTDTFTLVGVDALEGKLTLFDAEGPRESGALDRIVLRVREMNGTPAQHDAPGGLTIGVVPVESGKPDFDLDHVVLRVADPDAAAEKLLELGFSREDGRLVVGDRHVKLVGGGEPEGDRPLLNHLALLVDSVQDVQDAAEAGGHEVTDFKDAKNTLAVFLAGPDGISIEYVEHKPTFSLV